MTFEYYAKNKTNSEVNFIMCTKFGQKWLRNARQKSKIAATKFSFLSFQYQTAVISRASSWSTCFLIIFAKKLTGHREKLTGKNVALKWPGGHALSIYYTTKLLETFSYQTLTILTSGVTPWAHLICKRKQSMKYQFRWRTRDDTQRHTSSLSFCSETNPYAKTQTSLTHWDSDKCVQTAKTHSTLSKKSQTALGTRVVRISVVIIQIRLRLMG